MQGACMSSHPRTLMHAPIYRVDYCVMFMFCAMHPSGNQLHPAVVIFGSLYGAWQHTHLNACCPVCTAAAGRQPLKLRNQTAVVRVNNKNLMHRHVQEAST
jgi:hypothetical protein